MWRRIKMFNARKTWDWSTLAVIKRVAGPTLCKKKYILLQQISFNCRRYIYYPISFFRIRISNWKIWILRPKKDTDQSWSGSSTLVIKSIYKDSLSLYNIFMCRTIANKEGEFAQNINQNNFVMTFMLYKRIKKTAHPHLIPQCLAWLRRKR